MSEHDPVVSRWVLRLTAAYAVLCAGLALWLAFQTW